MTDDRSFGIAKRPAAFRPARQCGLSAKARARLSLSAQYALDLLTGNVQEGRLTATKSPEGGGPQAASGTSYTD